MRNWILKLWDGSNHRTRTIRAESYTQAVQLAGVDGYPPAYIWSIEEELGDEFFKNAVACPAGKSVIEYLNNAPNQKGGNVDVKA